MQRWKASALVAGLGLAFLLWLAPQVVLIVFAGLLFAVFLYSGGSWIAGRMGLSERAGIGLFALLLALGFAALFYAAAATIAAQFDEFIAQLPGALQRIRGFLDQYSWGRTIIERVSSSNLLSDSAPQAATSFLFALFGGLGNAAIILLIGIYVALFPEPYRKGFVLVFAPSLRPRVSYVLDASVRTLERWIAAQLISMTVVGVLTGLGLWLAGIPLAGLLGLIAGLFAFIPNIGPLLSLVPALLLALGGGMTAVLWVLAIYVAVQALESYLITPMAQQETVDVPPAFLLSLQLLFGVVLGLFGLALASPIAALSLTLVDLLYVKDYLEREPPEPAISPEASVSRI